MKKIYNLFTFSCLYLLVNSTVAQPVNNNPDLIGYFDGRTPCQEVARLLNEPTTADCWKIKWRLALYKNGNDSTTGAFSLEGFIYRKEHILKGNWKLTKGTKADPNALVYEIQHVSGKKLLFLKAGDEVLLFLDHEKNILVGNKNFSYALYRTFSE